MRPRDVDKSKAERRRKGKAPYATPTLTVHGDIEAVTANVGSEGSDGVMGSEGGMTHIEPP